MAQKALRGSAAEARGQGRRELDHRRWAKAATSAQKAVSGLSLPPDLKAQVAGGLVAPLYQLLGKRRAKETGNTPVVGMLKYLEILTGQATPYWPNALPPRRMMGLMGHMADFFRRLPQTKEEWQTLRDAIKVETGKRFRLRDMREQVEACRRRMAEDFPEQGFVVDQTGDWLRSRRDAAHAS
jgi:hypothetical protein